MRKSRGNKYLNILLVFLVMGMSNHCALEEAFSSIGQLVYGIDAPSHLENHVGSTSKHKHEHTPDSPEHEHGQPHTLAAITVDRSSGVYFYVLMPVLTYYLIPLVSAKSFSDLVSQFRTSYPNKLIQSSISSLVSAPQAPPFVSYS